MICDESLSPRGYMLILLPSVQLGPAIYLKLRQQSEWSQSNDRLEIILLYPSLYILSQSWFLFPKSAKSIF